MSGSLNLSKYLNQSRYLESTPLFPYVGKSIGVFKCPADKDLLRITNRSGEIQNIFPRHRSYSITSMLEAGAVGQYMKIKNGKYTINTAK